MDEDETKETKARRKRASIKEGIGKIIGDNMIAEASRAEKSELATTKRKSPRGRERPADS